MIENIILMRFLSFPAGLAGLILLFVFSSVLPTTHTALSLPTVMELDIEGDISISYSESSIKNSLPLVSGWGGKQKTLDPFKIDSPTFWKGVNLQSMLGNIVGDLDYNISVIPSDGYPPQNLTREELNGAIRTFDEENVTLDTLAIPVLAFEENNITLDAEDGPLRLVFIGENNNSILTISTIWVKHVDTIQINIEDESTVTISTTTIETSSSSTTAKSSSSSTTIRISPSSTLLISVPSLIFLILYQHRKRNR